MKNLIYILAIVLSSNLFAQIELVDYLNQSSASINLKVATDSNFEVEVAVTAKQPATMQLKGKDGTVYTLEIPADALLENATIKMTEIKHLGQNNFQITHNPYGVVLEPSGLEFAKPARLIIDLAKPIPTQTMVPISGMHNGDDISLAMIDINENLDPNKVTLMVSHFSTYSIFGSLTARETIFRAFNELTKNRISSWFADQVIKAKEGRPFDPDYFKKTLVDGFDLVVKPRLLNFTSCEGGRLALQDYLSWQRQAQLLGFEMDTSGQVPYARVATTKAASLCYDQAKLACYVDHRPFDVLVMALGFARQSALIGMNNDSEVDRLLELASKCINFEIEVTSSLTITDSYTMIAKGTGRFMVLNRDFFNPFVDGMIKIVDVKMHDMDDCTLVGIDAPEADFLMKKIFMNDIKFDQSLGVFINPISPKSNAHFECPIGDGSSFPISIPGTPEPSEIFGGFYMMLHSQPTANEFNPKKGYYEMFKWNVLHGEKFATKSYKRSVPAFNLEENTEFTIYHRPRSL